MSTTLQQDLSNQLRSNTGAMQAMDGALQQIFRSAEQTKTHKARTIMGELVQGLNDEELEVCITEFQYLLHAWFDEFERMQFDGLTLKELIME